jgi:hypothetical protein
MGGLSNQLKKKLQAKTEFHYDYGKGKRSVHTTFTVVFSHIFLYCSWPIEWTTSIVVPLYKKGNSKEFSNYRLIQISPIVSNSFCKIVDSRLRKWLEELGKLIEEQGGFRKEGGTIEQVFILHSIVRKGIMKRGGRIYVAFLDVRGAFDNVIRAMLVKRLLEIGLPVNFARLIVGIYSSVGLVVRILGKVSGRILTRIGLKQGCPLSPTLFNVYINDIVDFFKEESALEVLISVSKICMHLFADDIALIAQSAKEMQTLLHIIEEYLDMKGLELNKKKTVIVVFRKGGKLRKKDEFSFKGDFIEIKKQFVYFGVKFFGNGKYAQEVKHRVQKGITCMNLF